MTTRDNQLLLENENLLRNLRSTQFRLEDIQISSKIAEDNNRALSMLFEILYTFIESSDCLTAKEYNHFFGLSPQD